MEKPEFLTLAEVAAICRTSPSALYSQRLRNLPPGALGARVGKRVLYRAEDLAAYFESQRAEQRAPK